MASALAIGLTVGFSILLLAGILVPVFVFLVFNVLDKESWKPINDNIEVPVRAKVTGVRGTGGVASLDISGNGVRFIEAMFYTENTPDSNNLMNTTVWQIVQVGGGDSAPTYEYQPLGQILPGIWAIDDSGLTNGTLLQTASISGDGSTVAIGSPHGDRLSSSYRFGHVQVFEIDEAARQWNSLGQPLLQARDMLELPYLGTAEFGRSTSLSFDGKRMAVGVTHVNRHEVYLDGPPFFNVTDEIPLATHSYVQVLEYDSPNSNSSRSNEWSPLGNVMNGTCVYAVDDGCFPCASEDESFGENSFGQTVSMSDDGSRVVVGAPQNTDNCDERAVGFVRVFDYNDDGGEWNQVGSDIVLASEVNQYDKALVRRDFGRSVSISANGQLIAIGSNAGAVVMRLQSNSNDWVRVGGIFTHDNTTWANNRYTTVSLSGDGSRVAVGGQFGNDGRGVVTVYKWNGERNEWEWDGIPTFYEDNYFGRLIALSSNDARLAVSSEWWSWAFNSPTSHAGNSHRQSSMLCGLGLLVLAVSLAV